MKPPCGRASLPSLSLLLLAAACCPAAESALHQIRANAAWTSVRSARQTLHPSIHPLSLSFDQPARSLPNNDIDLARSALVKPAGGGQSPFTPSRLLTELLTH